MAHLFCCGDRPQGLWNDLDAFADLEGADAVEWDRLGHGRIFFGSGSLKQRDRNLADRANVVRESDPDQVQFRGIRIAPHVLARSHDDLADAIGEEMLG